MEIFSAASLPGRNRAVSWNELCATRLGRSDFEPRDPDFDAELRITRLGAMSIACLSCSPGTLDRSSRHIGEAPLRTWSLVLQLRGRSDLSHYGHQSTLEAGDLVLMDNAAPYTFRLNEAATLLMLRVPSSVLKEHLPSPESVCGRRLPGSCGLASAAARLAASLCSDDENWLPNEFQERVARHLLDLLATAYAMAFDTTSTASSVIAGRHAKVRLHIEQHLRDPTLSPASIATSLKLSSRYLRMIFASRQETVSGYILRRRLEECARQIGDPRWRGHSISEIAFAWGFNSASHFTRSFRERYGQSPRRWRLQQVEPRIAVAVAA